MGHRDTKWADAVGKNGTERLSGCRVATHLTVIKSAVSVQCNNAKHDKRTHVCLHPKELKAETWKDPPRFMAALFTIVKRWKPPKHWSRMNKQNVVSTHSGIFSSLKEETNSEACYNTEESRGHYTKWISQRRKDKYRVISLTWGSYSHPTQWDQRWNGGGQGWGRPGRKVLCNGFNRVFVNRSFSCARWRVQAISCMTTWVCGRLPTTRWEMVSMVNFTLHIFHYHWITVISP